MGWENCILDGWMDGICLDKNPRLEYGNACVLFF